MNEFYLVRLEVREKGASQTLCKLNGVWVKGTGTFFENMENFCDNNLFFGQSMFFGKSILFEESIVIVSKLFTQRPSMSGFIQCSDLF